MAWSGYAIALLLAYLLQTGVTALFDLPLFDPFLILAIICGLVAPTHDARIAGWITGLAQDLGSADALGIHAFTLGLTAMLLTQMRTFGNVGVWWVAALAGFIAAWPGQFLYLLHLHYWAGGGAVGFLGLLGTATWTAAIAAVFAMLINALPWAMHRRRRHIRSAHF